ncbi:hypothetical protein [Paraprevotella clara]
MRTTLNYGYKNYVSPEVRVMLFETEMMIAGSDMNPEPPNPGYNSGHNPDDFWDAWR